MYHSCIHFQIYSSSSSIEQQLSAVRPFERFEHSFRTDSAFSPESMREGDVCIFDLPCGSGPTEKMNVYKKKGSLTVLCAEPAVAASLSREVLDAADILWMKPLTQELLSFYFHALQQELKLRKEYRLSQIYLDTVIDNIPELIWFKDAQGAHLKVNNSFCRAVHKSKAQIEGRGHYYIWDIPKEEYAQGEYICLESEEVVMREGKTCLFDEKVKTKNGMRQFKTYKSPLFDEDETIMGTVGVAHDVTDLQNMNNELEIILRSVPFAVIVCSHDGVILNANEKFEEYFKISRLSIPGFIYKDWKASMFSNIAPSPRPGYENASVHVAGHERFLEIHEEPIVDIFGNLAGYLCLYNDITMERKYESETLRNANTDFLTGLSNRRYFYEYLAQRRGEQPVSLLYVDLDNFKFINDTYGHQIGDEALILAAGAIREIFPDDLTARIGGDEFAAAILGPCSRAVLCEKAEQLIKTMHEKQSAALPALHMTASVGISQTSDPSMSIDDLVKQSDLAMYDAKQSGKARCCLYHEHTL